MKGIIFEIERWSISDGPGTRTVVFLKGCPLKCQWCANPESQSTAPQIGIFTAKCIQCNHCQNACENGVAIPAKEGGFFADGACTMCGSCVEVCPPKSRRWMGEELTPEAVLDTIKKDIVFYRKSFGGVTFSGGEPLNQPKFLKEIIQGCQRVGIHTAIETCGAFNWKAAESTIGLIDFVMFDIKHMDSHRHRELTGSGNETILENAKRISDLGIPMMVRIPVIPTVNDSFDNIRATAQFVRDKLSSVTGIEVLPYHKLGLTKYAALGLTYLLREIETPDALQMETIRDIITTSGVKVITVDTDYL